MRGLHQPVDRHVDELRDARRLGRLDGRTPEHGLLRAERRNQEDALDALKGGRQGAWLGQITDDALDAGRQPLGLLGRADQDSYGCALF